MTDKNRRLPYALLAALAAIGLTLQGCSSGSGGSGVGGGGNVAPTARAQILNSSATNRVREGAEVLLTGKDSEDGDGPLLGWSWQQLSGPNVMLLERNPTTVSFTAPEVPDDTTLTFELTVEDSDGLTGRTSIEVIVVPGRDPDKFLSLDVRGTIRDTFDELKVVAALAEGASTDAEPKPFTLSVRAYVAYPPRTAPDRQCRFDPIDFAAGIPATTSAGCLVELLEDLTPEPLPNGGTGIQSEWPANVPEVERPDGPTADRINAEWWNPHFTLKIPRLDVTAFNQQFVGSGERSRMIDAFSAHRARIALHLELTAPQNQGDATLILNDVESAPITWQAQASASRRLAHGKIAANPGVGLPTSAIVPLESVLGGITARESALTAEVYYRTVDPFFERTTLNAWLQRAGFASDGNGTLLPDARAGTGEFAHAVYLNNYDLGFGRDMYARMDELGNVYSFVVNYGSLEAAIRGGFPIVTVVMEYSALLGPNDPTEKFVKFFTYVEDGSGDSLRVASMDFDGRGERPTPGNCVACHGGVAPPGVDELDFDPGCGDRLEPWCYTWPDEVRGENVANGNLGATFLPWDLDSLLFADTDPAITRAPLRFDGLSLGERLARDYRDFSRASQEAQLKKLNEAAHATYCDAAQQPGCVSDAARRLVEHWYGGVDQAGRLIGTFDDSEAPEGWRNNEIVAVPTSADPFATATNPGTAEHIYHTVFARHCRMCHLNMYSDGLRFDNYQKLIGQNLEHTIFVRGVMPAARLTADRFWVDFGGGAATAVAALAEELGVEPVDGHLSPTPRAEITDAPTTAERGDSVRLSGADSLFAHGFVWTLEHDATGVECPGSGGAFQSQAQLVGQGTQSPAFSVDAPGQYAVGLTITNADGRSAAIEQPVVISVANNCPQAADLSLAIALGELGLAVDLTLSGVANSGDVADGSAPAIELVAQSNVNVTINDGIAVVDCGAGCTDTAPSFFDFRIVDEDGDFDVGRVTMNVALALQPNAAPLTVQNVVARTPTFSNTTFRDVNVHALTSSGTGERTISLPSASSLRGGSLTLLSDGHTVRYRPPTGFVGIDQFNYTVTDSNPAEPQSASATVRLEVDGAIRFQTHIVGQIFNAPARNCASMCHAVNSNPARAAFNMSGTVAQVWPRAVQRLTSSSNLFTYPPSAGHTGVASASNWGGPSCTASDTTPFCIFLRWQQEGACLLGANGQPVTGSTCPAP